jgi:hypothetical protein
MANTISVISPYKSGNQWVFDDDSRGLTREAFVSGADDIIDQIVEKYEIKDARNGFILLFSAEPFPGHQTVLTWSKAAMTGNWYHSSALDMDGWLCSSLLKYFDSVPPKIYAQFKSRA